MFRHSDGNKNSWEEREKANKAFLSVHHHGRHHRHQPCLHFIKISANFWSFPPSIWQNGGSQNSGIPAPTSLDSHLLLIPEPDLSPAAHFFLSRRHFLNLFFVRCSAKSSYSSRQSFPMAAAQARMLHNAVVGAMSSFQQWCAAYFISQTRDGWYMFFFSQVLLQLFLAWYLI